MVPNLKQSAHPFFNHESGVRLAVVCGLLCLWQAATVIFTIPDLPSPIAVTDSLLWHVYHGTLLSDLGITLFRVLVSFCFAMLLGCIIGILMGANVRFNLFADGLLIIFLNIPALVTIILCYIWFGLEEAAAITAVVINKIPTVVIAVREGARMVNQDLMDVAKVYQLSAWRTLRYVYLPQLYPYMMSAARNGLSLIWKSVLVVELLGRSDGIGFSLHALFQFFDIAGIMAYTAAFMLVMFSIEAFVMRPLDKVIARGR